MRIVPTMSNLSEVIEPTQEMRDEWQAWVEGRPPVVRAIAEKLPPWRPYRLTTTGQICRVQAFAEDGTVRIVAEHPTLGEFTRRSVFGIDPATLVPWVAGDEFRLHPNREN